jgi:hypothetical protein
MRKLSLFALVLSGACGGGDEPPLNAQEQAVVMAQMFSVAGTALSASQPPPGTALVGTPAVIQINETEACPGGGTFGVAGMASGFMDMNGNGQASADVMITLTSCGSVPVNGHVFVLNGAPYLSITSSAAWAGGALTSASMTFSGAFCWDDGCAQPAGTGDANKVCDIAVSFDLVRGSGSGHICDMEVNYGR